MKDVAIVGYCRTGIAKAGRGALNQTHGIPMAAHVLRQAVERTRIDPAEVEDVVLGCGLPEGATGHNIARNAALEAGFGVAVPGVTISRYCGSGLNAASIVANRIAAGEARLAIAGGIESISLVQFNRKRPRIRAVAAAHARCVVDHDPDRRFRGQKYGISRDAQDAYVVDSQKRVAAATAAGKFAAEIVPFTTTMKVTDKVTKETHDEEVTLDHDEGPRAGHDVGRAGRAQARLSRQHDDGGQCFTAVRWRRRRGHDGCRSRGTARTAHPRPVPRHATRRGRARLRVSSQSVRSNPKLWARAIA
jgi:acetyl-CoA C-acetyltransferase